MENDYSLIANALADTFACLFYLDLDTEQYSSYKNNWPQVQSLVPIEGNIRVGLKSFEQHLCQPEYSEKIRDFVNIDTINQRMKSLNTITLEFEGSIIKWCSAIFIVCSRHKDGSIEHMILGIKDITMEKMAEIEQETVLKDSIAANQAKTRMLQNMTHEIRTPLNAMYGFSQLLCLPSDCLTDEEKAKYFDYIRNSFNMLTMLIDDVLDLADNEHGNYRTIMEEVKVNDVCRSAMQMAEIRKPFPVNMYMTTDVDDDYTIQSDGKRVQQVLINFLTNSCKHTAKGEIEVQVSTTDNPGRITLAVRDTGEGIPEDQADDVFQRYKKANAMVQGSGLGLNICSIIAEKLNARIGLDKEYKNGARFFFVI